MENTQESVTSIASQCRYDSVNTFLRQFKTIMETSPLQYRKEMKAWLERAVIIFYYEEMQNAQ